MTESYCPVHGPIDPVAGECCPGVLDAPHNRRTLNLTQHPVTPEQTAAGVVEPKDKALVQRLLTFSELPTREQIQDRAVELAGIAVEHGVYQAMIGGAPFFMSALEAALLDVDVQPLYAFSRREVIETVCAAGSIEKKSVFRHAGFVPA